MTLYYAGIGSRETPEHELKRMYKLARVLAPYDCVLRSGGAGGADETFERGCDSLGGKKEIFLPKPKFRGNPSQYCEPPVKCYLLAAKERTNFGKLKPFTQDLFARNVQQILGPKPGVSPKTNFILCWTSDGKAKGGTGFAITLAEKHKIPILNLYNYSQDEDLLKALTNIIKNKGEYAND